MELTKKQVIKLLQDNKDAIFFSFCKCSIKKYLQTLKQNDITDEKYKKHFASFYNFRCPSGWRDVYFQILNDNKDLKIKKDTYSKTFVGISKELYTKSADCNGRLSHQFSFITKLLNTINPHLPIYDSRVATVLGIERESNDNYTSDANIMVKMIDLYNEIIYDDDDFALILNEFDTHYSMQEICKDEKFIQYANYKITSEKKLDFMLWTLASIDYE